MKRKVNAGFTLGEILIVVAIVALTIAILRVGFQKARESARRTTFGQNLGAIHCALEMYATDNSGIYPAYSATSKTPARECDAQLSLNLLYRQYTDDMRILSCPSRPLSAAMTNAILPSTSASWPGTAGLTLKEAAPGTEGTSTSYGYSPGHIFYMISNAPPSPAVVMADRKGTGPNGNSDNHGRDAGQNTLTVSGAVEFRDGLIGKRNRVGKDNSGADVFDDDIFSRDPVLSKIHPDWDSYCR